MADLVSDDAPDRAVVDRVVRGGIEVGRLEDPRRKHDLVRGRVVVGVHGGRRHAPFRPIHLLVDPLHLAIPLEDIRALHVPHQIVPLDLERRVVAPGIGVRHLDREVPQLLERLLPGLGGHPVQSGQILAIRLEEVLDQRLNFGLRFGREVFRDIFPADCFAHRAFVDQLLID